MSIYSKYIFPRFLDIVMQKKFFTQKRFEVLKNVSGKVLEIGVGTGLNFQAYPNNIREIYTVDINPSLHENAIKRADQNNITLHHSEITAENLPFDDESFDTVVSTWTLCSIPNVEQALKEINRVLKKNGKFVFIEHGASRKDKVLKWQCRCNSLWNKIGDGCNLNRDMKVLIENAGFVFRDYAEYETNSLGVLVGHMYQGEAQK